MNKNNIIAITGAAGFIGSYLTGYLNSLGYEKLLLVDDFTKAEKEPNLIGKKYLQQISRDTFIGWCNTNPGQVQYIFHLGARTDTTEMDYAIHQKWNVDYSKDIWNICVQQNIPLLYASSAATYGNGELGYNDAHGIVDKLQPLNPYGVSKNEFDKWVLQQTTHPPFWTGVKFFNVYGPNEYHKGRMASVIMHAYNQIQNGGKVKLFRSHNPDYKDGEQIRDFIYVADVVNICTWLMENQPQNGLYNIGTGKARTFKDLVTAIFETLHLPLNIEFVDTPIDIRDKYQYFTEANMQKLEHAGYTKQTFTLEEGIADYVNAYLSNHNYY